MMQDRAGHRRDATLSVPIVILVGIAVVMLNSTDAVAQTRSITDNSITWPTWEKFWRALTLRDHTTRVVVIGTTLLGMAAGVIGTFAYLRKRAMLGDALSHATLPGIALAFLIIGEKQLGWLTVGAAVTGVVGVLAVMGLRRIPRVKEDAAIGIVLSVFFGVGMVLLSLIQELNTGKEAGLGSFIYGKAAAMLTSDAQTIGVLAGVVVLCCVLLFKEFRLVCFDQAYASAQGWPVALIDLLMMSLVVLTTVVGLQAVGLILVVALLIVPAAAARFWTDALLPMTLVAAAFGAISGWFGSTVSAFVSRMPTGAVIVLSAGVLFLISMIASPHRGVLATILRRWQLARRIADQHLLRAMAEFEESRGLATTVDESELWSMRSWTASGFSQVLARAARTGWIARNKHSVQLTETGRASARRVLTNHRLWELYLIRYADIAPSHVDRDADEIEHVLSEELVTELRQALKEKADVPPSPHNLGAGI